jgi:hypothetical protein
MGNTAFCVLRTADLDQYSAGGGDLRESPRGGAGSAEHRPAAGREEHRASRRGSHTPVLENTALFRLLCALVRRELVAHRELNFGNGYADLVAHMKDAAAKARLPYGQDRLTRALDAVEAAIRRRAPRGSVVRELHWRDRCAHTPKCSTPTQCELRAAREGR